jgi:hypothetical protein
VDRGNPRLFSVSNDQATVTLRLLKGKYQVDAGISSTSPDERSLTFASEPEVTLDADRMVVLDATRGRRVSVQVDRADTVTESHALTVTSQLTGSPGIPTMSFLFADATPYAVPTRPVTGRFYEFTYEPVLGVPVPGVTPRRFSPIYTLALATKGRIPEQLAFVARDRDLARVHASYRAQGVLGQAERIDFLFTPQRPSAARLSSPGRQPLPSQRVEYFSQDPDFRWSHHLITTIATEHGLRVVEREQAHDQTYRPGRYEVAWNRAPLGPAFMTQDGILNRREPGAIFVGAAPFSGNEEGYYTQSFKELGLSGTTRLTRDGVTLNEGTIPCIAFAFVPDSPGRYTLTCTATRSLPTSVLGTRSEAEWTFAAPGQVTTPVPLPLLVVRATGAVFAMNDAPTGRLFPLVLRVDRVAGAPSARITSLELDASFDDGATWKSVPVLRVPGSDRGLVVLKHPRTPGFVSLRMRAADAGGNSVTHTTIRAYGLTVVP